MKLKKWEVLIICLVFIGLCSLAWALASEKITVSSTAVSLTAATYGTATSAQVAVETAGIRWTCDPSITLTTTLGIPAAANSYIWLDTPWKIRNFKALRSGASDATIQVEYFKAGE